MVLSIAQTRLARLEDSPEIYYLWRDLINDNTSLDKIKDMIADRRGRRDRLCIIKNDCLIGFIAYNIKNKIGHIAGIAIDSCQQQSGLGSTLLRIMEEDLKDNGFDEIMLEVKTDNEIASKFYIKNGYYFSNITEDFYGKGKDALIFRKELCYI